MTQKNAGDPPQLAPKSLRLLHSCSDLVRTVSIYDIPDEEGIMPGKKINANS